MLEEKNPYEKWLGLNPQINHVRVFGCVLHVGRLGGTLKKLDDKSVPMVFIGHEKGKKGYRA